MINNIKSMIKDVASIPFYIGNNIERFETIQSGALAFIDNCKIRDYSYKFSDSVMNPTLFSSVYAMLIMGLTGEEIFDSAGWSKYFDSFQCEDGIWRDNKFTFSNWPHRDTEWNDIHLIPHIIYAYEKIGQIPLRRFSFLDKFTEKSYVQGFCQDIDFDSFWESSNGLMNYLVAMIYSRDVMDNFKMRDTIQYIMAYLEKRMIETNGLWTQKKDKKSLYEAVRGGYHVWMLMIKEKVSFNDDMKKNIIDVILSLQNKWGGYNKDVISDICHNIDCIDPLIRFSIMIPDYRRDEIELSIRKARNYLLGNRNKDGGFCFARMNNCRYGSKELFSARNKSNMFSTWFTLLAITIIEEYLDEKRYIVSDLPGMQYKLRIDE